MVNKKWDLAIATIESQWKVMLGDAYDTLKLYSKENGIVDQAPHFLLEMYHPQDILKNPEKRNIIISVLPENYAKELAESLSIKNFGTQDLYNNLKNIKYTSKVELKFLNFFGIEPQKKIPPVLTIGVETIAEEILEYPMRQYQKQVISDMEHIFAEGRRRCMVQMPTGSGKTRTAMYYITKLMNNSENVMVLWLAYSKELCDQASDEFCKVWKIRGDGEATVFRYYGNSDCVLPVKKCNGIIVTTLSKIISSLKKDPYLLANVSDVIDLVVFDEAHQIIAPQYNSIVNTVINLSRHSKLIGLSATPGRTWNDPEEDQKLSDYFNQNLVRISTPNGESPNELLTKEGYLSKIEWRYCECKTPILTDHDLNLIKEMREEDEIPKQILETISTDAIRNTKIVGEVEKLLIDGNTRILLFATSVTHAHIMTGLLKLISNKYECDVDCIAGSISSSERDNIINKFKSDRKNPMVLCNYGVLTTGFDAPKIDAGVIARPTKSVVLFSQMVGRMIRGPRSGGTEKATIVSVVDLGLPGFKDSYNNWSDVWNV